jgi:hypothetical protein
MTSTDTQAASIPAVVPEKRRRGRRAATAVSVTATFYDGSIAPDGNSVSVGKPFGSEVDAQRAFLKTGKPYFKIEVMRAELAEVNGKLIAVTAPVKK